MYIILVYDISKEGNGQKRWNHVFKLCKQYLCHVQKSVFEGDISEADLFKLEKSMEKEIDKTADSVLIFKSRNERWLDKKVLGLKQEDVFFYLIAHEILSVITYKSGN